MESANLGLLLFGAWRKRKLAKKFMFKHYIWTYMYDPSSTSSMDLNTKSEADIKGEEEQKDWTNLHQLSKIKLRSFQDLHFANENIL